MFKDGCKKSSYLNRIILLICIFTTTTIWSGCNRKVGVKPGGQLKSNTSKCKCKKRSGGIYSETFIQKSKINCFDLLNDRFVVS